MRRLRRRCPLYAWGTLTRWVVPKYRGGPKAEGSPTEGPSRVVREATHSRCRLVACAWDLGQPTQVVLVVSACAEEQQPVTSYTADNQLNGLEMRMHTSTLFSLSQNTMASVCYQCKREATTIIQLSATKGNDYTHAFLCWEGARWAHKSGAEYRYNSTPPSRVNDCTQRERDQRTPVFC